MQYFAKTCRSKRIICGEIKKKSSVQGLCLIWGGTPKCHIPALGYLKTHNKFYGDISISEGLSSKFSDINEHQDVGESIHQKIVSNEIEYDSVEDPLSMHRTASNEIALGLKVPYIFNDENTIVEPGQEKKTVSILSDELCKE